MLKDILCLQQGQILISGMSSLKDLGLVAGAGQEGPHLPLKPWTAAVSASSPKLDDYSVVTEYNLLPLLVLHS